MPKALIWNDDDDARLLRLIKANGATMRNVARDLGISRSCVQRRVDRLNACSLKAACAIVRDHAGPQPLVTGHAISWGAIVQNTPALLALARRHQLPGTAP